MERMQNTKKHVLLGAILLLLSCSIVSVSAYIYEQNSQNVTQTIVDIATLTLTNSTLGNLEEGQTLLYIPSNQSDLDDIISVTTTKANVYLHLDSDLDSLTDYATYNIVVKFSQVQGSTYSVGDNLDVAGTWIFDFEVTTTASTVFADVPSTVTITVSAESTS
jgi:hypothetical protein